MWMYHTESGSNSGHGSSPAPGRGTSPLPGSVSPPEGRGSIQQQRIRRRNRLITSCLECRRRKLKCDKQAPCTNCTRFKRDCLYLAPSQDPKSQQKLADIKEKMGQLEQSLEQEVASHMRRSSDAHGTAGDQYVKQEPQSDEEAEDEEDLEPTVLTAVDTVYEDDGDDELMDLGIQLGKVRISERIGGWVRPKLVEELTDTLNDVKTGKSGWSTPPQQYDQYNIRPSPRQQSMHQPPKAYLGPGEDFIAPSTSFFFPGTNMASSLIDYLPTKVAADQLISQYFAAVHYVAKVVHRPTFEAQYQVFWTEIGSGNEPPASIQAIMFAAMFSAVVSMSENQVLHHFGNSKSVLIDSFRSGTELALAKANFLRTTRTDTMQAFVIYLIPLIRAEVSRAHSSLVGAAIRLAECMGLHRDPLIYGMGPVETHVRRMIWYQLCFLDMRTCESTGPRPQIRREDYDTKLPLNVDDTDLLDPITSAVVDQAQWTDMTLTRLRLECIEMHRALWFDIQSIDKKKKSLTSVLIKVQKFRSRMEEQYGEIIDKSVPLQNYAAHVMSIYINRCFVQVLNRYLISVQQRMPDRLRQILLTTGTESMEAAIALETTPEFAPWAWYKGAYQQYHIALLFLTEVYTYPMRKEAGRIWQCLDYIFDLPKELSPKQKAEMLLTEMRDRMQVYQSMRKLKASTQMEEKMSAIARSRRDSSGGRGSSIPLDSHPSLGHLPQHVPEFSFSHLPPSQFSPPPFHSGSSVDGSRSASMSVHGDVSGSIGSGGIRGGGNVATMEDIDWAELDKYFPIDSNAGELNVPNFDFANFTGSYGSLHSQDGGDSSSMLQTSSAPADEMAGGVSVPSIDDLAEVNFTQSYVPGYVGQKDFGQGNKPA